MNNTLAFQVRGSRDSAVATGLSEGDAILIGACISAATSIVIAGRLQSGADAEKQIIARAHMLYEAAVSRFGSSRVG